MDSLQLIDFGNELVRDLPIDAFDLLLQLFSLLAEPLQAMVDEPPALAPIWERNSILTRQRMLNNLARNTKGLILVLDSSDKLMGFAFVSGLSWGDFEPLRLQVEYLEVFEPAWHPAVVLLLLNYLIDVYSVIPSDSSESKSKDSCRLELRPAVLLSLQRADASGHLWHHLSQRYSQHLTFPIEIHQITTGVESTSDSLPPRPRKRQRTTDPTVIIHSRSPFASGRIRKRFRCWPSQD